MTKFQKKYEKMIIFLSLFSLLLSIMPVVSSSPITIYGTAEHENGEIVDEAIVIVNATGYQNKTTTTSEGAWQIDVGSETGTPWPEGTNFSVLVTSESYTGLKKGTVQGSITNVGTIILHSDSPNHNISTIKDSTENNSYETESPIAIISPEFFYETTVNKTISFSGEESYDINGTITGFRWDFDGDGVYDTPWNEKYDITHSYSIPGFYQVFLQVKDKYNNTDNESAYVDVSSNLEPVEIKSRKTGYTGQNISFEAIHNSNVSVVNYTWDFDDTQINGYGKITYHTYKTPGVYLVKIYVIGKNNEQYHDGHVIEIKLDTDKDLLSDTLEELIGSSPFSKNTFISLQLKFKNHMLIDTDNDGLFDIFYNSTAENFSSLKIKNESYIIDNDLDGVYDISYNQSNGKISTYSEESLNNNDTTNNETSDEIDNNSKESPTLSLPVIVVFLMILSVFYYLKEYKK